MKTTANTLLLIATIIVNFFLLQVLFWGSIYTFIESPIFASICLIALCGILGTTIIMVVRYFKNKSFFRVAPILSGGISILVIVATLIAHSTQADSQYLYEEGQYQYRRELWHDKDGYVIKVRISKRPRNLMESATWNIDTEYTGVPNKIKDY